VGAAAHLPVRRTDQANSCDFERGVAAWDFLKKRLKELGLSEQGRVLRSKANCLRICKPARWRWSSPEGAWYRECDPPALETNHTRSISSAAAWSTESASWPSIAWSQRRKSSSRLHRLGAQTLIVRAISLAVRRQAPPSFVSGIGCRAAAERTSRAAAASTAPASTPARATAPVATVKQVMAGMVSPSAMFMWDSVATTVSASGTEEKQPQTDADWAQVATNAALLVESAKPARRP
jgi:hypothetical protein